MPVRKVSNRGGRNATGYVQSLKLGRDVGYESELERRFILLLESDADVEWYEEQPFEIPYEYDEKLRHYTPDFHLLKKDQHTVAECKPEKLVSTEENQRKFAIARAWCAVRGWYFLVVTDTLLYRGYRVKNILLMHQFAPYCIPPEQKASIRESLKKSPTPVTIAELAFSIDPQNPQSLVIPLLHMAFHHGLWLPLDDEPISENTLVRLP